MRSPVLLALAVVAGCTGQSAVGVEPTTAPSTTSTTTTSAPSTTTTSTSTSTTTTTSTTSSTSTSTTTSTTTPTTFTTIAADAAFGSANRAFDALARANPAATMTVMRDGVRVLSRASGVTIDGAVATSDSPMVVASISKLLTGAMVARLHQSGLVDVDAPTPWNAMGIAPHPGWGDVTPRELLNHTSGMAVARAEWFKPGGDCATFLPSLLDRPPGTGRGRWTYSNGNYCALGLLVEHVTAMPLDRAAQAILLDPLGLTGVYLTTNGQLPTHIAYALGVDRLARLGGAGTFAVSTDIVTAVLASVTPADLEVMTWPGLIVDQYGWGHTGSIDGAIACAWVLEGGRTVVAATVAGRSPSSGGDVCDRVVPAVAGDLGISLGIPDRSPP